MPRSMKLTVAAVLCFMLVVTGYIFGHLDVRLIPTASAQTPTSNLTLSKPSCASQPALPVTNTTGEVIGMFFVCVADLDGNGKNEVILGASLPGPNGSLTQPGANWQVRIVDGTGVERGTGTKLGVLP